MLGVSFKKEIVPIAMPIFVGMVVFQIQILTNRAFLGHLEVEYLSMISNVVFPLWTTMAMLNSLTTGATILMSQSIGAKDTRRSRQVAAAALKWNSLISLVLFAFWITSADVVFRAMGVTGVVFGYCVDYTRIAAFSFLASGCSSAMVAVFQASGQTRPLMYSGALRSLLNVLLDWLLIFGSLGMPRLGFLGAAVASVVADVAGTLLLVVLLLRGRQLDAKPTLRAVFAAPLAVYKDVVRMGFPTSMEDLLWNVGNLVLIRFLNALDPLAAAVYSLIFTIEILPIALFVSLGQTTTILVGKAKGAGDLRRAKGAALSAQAAAWLSAVAIVVVFAVIPTVLVGIFTRDAAIVARAAPILLVSCVTFFPRSVNFMAGSAIRGLGNTRWMLGTQVFGTVFIIALGWVLIFAADWGVIGLFIAMSADETVRAVVNGLHFWKSVKLPLAPAVSPMARAA